MKTLYFSMLCLSFSVITNAQTSTKKELKLIENDKQAQEYLETYKSKKNKLITFNEEKHNTTLAKALFKLPKKGTKISESEFSKTFYKVIEKNKIQHYRVSYVYLDGDKMVIERINSLRKKIVSKYQNGLPFSNLVKRYSMDQSADKGGDLGWFTKGDMDPEFESQATNPNYSVGDIFMVDIPSKNTYYVVVKTHEPKDIKEIKVLKVVEAKR